MAPEPVQNNVLPVRMGYNYFAVLAVPVRFVVEGSMIGAAVGLADYSFAPGLARYFLPRGYCSFVLVNYSFDR